jgi:hypothetical protein
VYVDESGWALGVVAGPATRVPCALAVASATGADLDLRGVVGAEVGEGELRLRGDDAAVVVRVGRLVNATVPRLRARPSREVLAVLHRHALPALEELGAEAVAGVVGDPARLLGLGSGLTPVGDDVLAGWAAASFALGAPVTGADGRRRTTLLSATLLECARRGEVLPELRALLYAMARVDQPGGSVHRAAAALALVGHTSGAGLLLGVWLRLRTDDR